MTSVSRSALVALLMCVASPAHAAPKEMSIQVRKGEIRSAPSFLAAVTATAGYGERLTVLEEKGAWMKVSDPEGKVTGWVHSSALTRKRIKLEAGEKDAEVAASSSELALAGKGFNSDVEAEFKNRHKDVDFTWVDKMEKITVTPDQMREFLGQGDVTPAGGE